MFSKKPLPVTEPVAGKKAVRVVFACVVTPVAVLSRIMPGPMAEIVAFVGNPKPVMAIPVAKPSILGTKTVWLPAVVVAPVIVTGIPPALQVRLVLACVVMPVAVVTVIDVAEGIAVMNSFAGSPVPVTSIPMNRPVVEGTVTVVLPAVVAAPVTDTVVGAIGTVKLVVPFTAEICSVPF